MMMEPFLRKPEEEKWAIFDWLVMPSCKFLWSCDTNDDLLLGNTFYSDISGRIHRCWARSIFTFNIVQEVTFGSQIP